jgi:hypothetical protein
MDPESDGRKEEAIHARVSWSSENDYPGSGQAYCLMSESIRPSVRDRGRKGDPGETHGERVSRLWRSQRGAMA